jgi:hypothetical protein
LGVYERTQKVLAATLNYYFGSSGSPDYFESIFGDRAVYLYFVLIEISGYAFKPPKVGQASSLSQARSLSY